MPFPTTNQSPYGPALKAYIDEQVALAVAAATAAQADADGAAATAAQAVDTANQASNTAAGAEFGLGSKADVGHVHGIDAVSGLQDILDSLSSAGVVVRTVIDSDPWIEVGTGEPVDMDNLPPSSLFLVLPQSDESNISLVPVDINGNPWPGISNAPIALDINMDDVPVVPDWEGRYSLYSKPDSRTAGLFKGEWLRPGTGTVNIDLNGFTGDGGVVYPVVDYVLTSPNNNHSFAGTFDTSAFTKVGALHRVVVYTTGLRDPGSNMYMALADVENPTEDDINNLVTWAPARWSGYDTTYLSTYLPLTSDKAPYLHIYIDQNEADFGVTGVSVETDVLSYNAGEIVVHKNNLWVASTDPGQTEPGTDLLVWRPLMSDTHIPDFEAYSDVWVADAFTTVTFSANGVMKDDPSLDEAWNVYNQFLADNKEAYPDSIALQQAGVLAAFAGISLNVAEIMNRSAILAYTALTIVQAHNQRIFALEVSRVTPQAMEIGPVINADLTDLGDETIELLDLSAITYEMALKLNQLIDLARASGLIFTVEEDN